MASRQSVGSILKPSKKGLKMRKNVDEVEDENPDSLPKRKVSFSGMNKIKMYNTGATSLTVHQAPMFDETLSDSSNGEKTKLSGDTDDQITFESNDYTSVENNGRVVIEYESPNDNMEMTEAICGQIFSDTINTIGNNVPEHIDYSSDYSECNMEFTEAVKIDQIITVGMMESYVSSVEIPETLSHEDDSEPKNQYDRKLLTPLPNPEMFAKSTTNNSLNSSDMEFTNVNTKIISIDLSSQSTNMEFTCMTTKSQELICSNDGYKSNGDMGMDMDSTQLPVEQKLEDNDEIKKKCSFELEISKNDILRTNTSGIDNYSNKQFIDGAANYNDIDVEEISLSEVSMDIDDPVSEGNDNDISYVNVEVPKSITNEQNKLISTTEQFTNSGDCSKEHDVLDYSEVIEIGIQQEKSKELTDYLSDPETFPTPNVAKYVVAEEPLQTNTSYACSSVFEQNQYVDNDTSSINEKKQKTKNYSRKTLVPIKEKYSRNDDISGISLMTDENELNLYSIKSVPLTSDLNLTKIHENSILSDTSMMDGENPQEIRSRKSIAPTSDLNSTKSYENEILSDTSEVEKVNLPKNYSRKSLAPTSFLNSTKFYENEVSSDTSEMEEVNPQKNYSRKSVASATVLDQTKFYENDILSDTSETEEENQQKNYSRKSIAPTTVLNLTKSYENEIVSDTSVTDTESLQKKYSRKSLAPSSMCKVIESHEHGISNFVQDESLKECISNSSLLVDKNESVSMTSEVPVLINDLSITSNECSIKQLDVSKHYQEEMSKSVHRSVLLDVLNHDDFNSPFRKKSRKSVVPSPITKQEPNVELSTESTNSLLNDKSKACNEKDLSDSLECKSNVKSSSSNGVFLAKQSSNLSVIKGRNSSVFMNDLLIQKSLCDGGQSYQFLDILPENKKLDTSVDCFDDMDKTNIVMQPNELENIETNSNELNESNAILKNIENENTDATLKIIDNNINKTGHVLNDSSRCSIDKTTDEICVEELSNMSISDETPQNNEKLPTGIRKRSYSSRNCGPISCSSFMSKPNTNSSMNEDDAKEYFIKESPIKENVSKDDSIGKDSLMTNIAIGVDLVEEESVSEHLSNDVLEFLSKWKSQFVEKILTLNKCTNRAWTFNVLDNNVLLTVTFSPVFNDRSSLKVEDIALVTNTIVENEITKFGINWILSKYNPKIYKEICYTSRDVDLLLKSLLEDVQFISLVMKNMVYMRDFYCVTFNDNKAQYILHSMKHLFMARIDISLLNVHKFSIKDINVDFVFGSFDVNAMGGIVENLKTKDCNILQTFIKKLEVSFTS